MWLRVNCQDDGTIMRNMKPSRIWLWIINTKTVCNDGNFDKRGTKGLTDGLNIWTEEVKI